MCCEIPKGYFVVKKLVSNVIIKALYTKIILTYFLTIVSNLFSQFFYLITILWW